MRARNQQKTNIADPEVLHIDLHKLSVSLIPQHKIERTRGPLGRAQSWAKQAGNASARRSGWPNLQGAHRASLDAFPTSYSTACAGRIRERLAPSPIFIAVINMHRPRPIKSPQEC